MIKYGFDKDGAFISVDTGTGLTCYAYPTSPATKQAKRNPVKIAHKMIEGESWRLAAKFPSQWLAEDIKAYDARNMASLGIIENGGRD